MGCKIAFRTWGPSGIADKQPSPLCCWAALGCFGPPDLAMTGSVESSLRAEAKLSEVIQGHAAMIKSSAKGGDHHAEIDHRRSDRDRARPRRLDAAADARSRGRCSGRALRRQR